MRYQISDARDYALNARDWNSLRDGILYQSATTVLAGMNVEDAMTVRKDYIGQEALRLAQQEFDQLRLGVQLTAFEIKEVTPPAPVLPSFQAVISAKVRAKTEIEQANTYAATTLPAARADRLSPAAGRRFLREAVVATAKGQASSFTALLAQYRQNPKIVEARLYGETMSDVMTRVKIATYAPNGSKVFIDPSRTGSPAAAPASLPGMP